MKTVLKYPGAKEAIAKNIISLFPSGYKKMTYLEPFFGSGAIFFNKGRSTIETINDIDLNIFNLFKQIRENGEVLSDLILNTPWHREEYRLSYIKTDNDLENARRMLVRYWFSIGARANTITGFRTNVLKNGGNYSSFHAKLPLLIKDVADRLKSEPGALVQIECKDALGLIDRYNQDNVLMFLDPPYVLSTRTNKKIYNHEFTDNDHFRLCSLIKDSKAKILISGYDNDLYNTILAHWKKEFITSIDERHNLRTEVIWMNYKHQPMLF